MTCIATGALRVSYSGTIIYPGGHRGPAKIMMALEDASECLYNHALVNPFYSSPAVQYHLVTRARISVCLSRGEGGAYGGVGRWAVCAQAETQVEA